MSLLHSSYPGRVAVLCFVVAVLVGGYGAQFVWQEHSAWWLAEQLGDSHLVTQATVDKNHRLTNGRGRVTQQEISYHFAPLRGPVIHVQDYVVKDSMVHDEATMAVAYLADKPQQNLPLYDIQADPYTWKIHAIDLLVGELVIVPIAVYNLRRYLQRRQAANPLARL